MTFNLSDFFPGLEFVVKGHKVSALVLPAFFMV